MAPVPGFASSAGAAAKATLRSRRHLQHDLAGAAEKPMQQLGHDAQPLKSWVGELLALSTEDASAAKATETGTDLGELLRRQRERYRVCFAELANQVHAHSPDLARLLRKVWAGADSACGAVMRRQSALQAHCGATDKRLAQGLSQAERRTEAMALKLEHADLQLTIATAALRDRDGQLTTLRKELASTNTELAKHRKLIGQFIEGRHEDAHGGGSGFGERDARDDEYDFESVSGAAPSAAASALDDDGEYAPGVVAHLAVDRRASVYDLDDQLDEGLAAVLREEERQFKTLSDMDALVHTLDPDRFDRLAALSELHVHRATAEAQTDHSGPLGDAAARGDGAGAGDGAGGAGGRPGSPLAFVVAPPPKAPKTRPPAGLHVPVLLRAEMSGFPGTMRIPSLEKTLKVTLHLYLGKLGYDRSYAHNRHADDASPKERLGTYAYTFYMERYGLDALADMHSTQLVLALEHHRAVSKRLRLLGDLLGVGGPEDHSVKQARPVLTERDADFLFGLLETLQKSGDFTEAMLHVGEGMVDVKRKTALKAVAAHFEDVLPDHGIALSQRCQSLPPPARSRNPKQVDLDDLLDLAAEAWLAANVTWRSHLQHLFKQYCTHFSVVHEMQFADDSGAPAHDALLCEVLRAKGHGVKFRPARLVRRAALQLGSMTDAQIAKTVADASAAADENGDHDGEHGDDQQPTHSPPSGAMVSGAKVVVSLIERAGFGDAAALILPNADRAEADRLFGAAVALVQDRLVDEFETVWEPLEETAKQHKHRRKKDAAAAAAAAAEGAALDAAEASEDDAGPRRYYHNRVSERTQWAVPYTRKAFVPVDIDVDAFVDACLQENVLVSSPFVHILDKEPTDLWANTEVYLQQIEDGQLGQK